MRKTNLLATVCLMAVLLSGCNSGESGSVVENVSKADSTQDNRGEQDELYAPLLPDNSEIFSEAEINVVDSDGGTEYSFTVSGYQDGEYDKYVAKCKELGFTDTLLDQRPDNGAWIFNAHSEDGKYFVVVTVDTYNGYLRIRAGAVKD